MLDVPFPIHLRQDKTPLVVWHQEIAGVREKRSWQCRNGAHREDSVRMMVFFADVHSFHHFLTWLYKSGGWKLPSMVYKFIFLKRAIRESAKQEIYGEPGERTGSPGSKSVHEHLGVARRTNSGGTDMGLHIRPPRRRSGPGMIQGPGARKSARPPVFPDVLHRRRYRAQSQPAHPSR